MPLWILWIAYADAGAGQPVRGLQDTPASSECRQLCSPQALFGHCSSVSSLPVQRTSSSHTRPEPLPKCAWPHAFATPLQRKEKAQKNRRFVLQYNWYNQKQMHWLALTYKIHGAGCCICLIWKMNKLLYFKSIIEKLLATLDRAYINITTPTPLSVAYTKNAHLQRV